MTADVWTPVDDQRWAHLMSDPHVTAATRSLIRLVDYADVMRAEAGDMQEVMAHTLDVWRMAYRHACGLPADGPLDEDHAPVDWGIVPVADCDEVYDLRADDGVTTERAGLAETALVWTLLIGIGWGVVGLAVVGALRFLRWVTG